MLMQSDVVVTAFKASKGEMNGKPYDSTKVYIETDMQSGERSKGIVSTQYTWGLSSNYDLIEKFEPPFKARAIFNVVNNGVDSKTLLVDLVPEKVQPKSAS
ncbi:hypothetical protein B9T29_15550 [Acinetobacter sp. ANC 3903]|uniref:hypothetical protein n=1 Tax=Acinetobacter sp. ANC 3903 TaxID=1977883 RepID=UPI000A33B0BC|nr:hypothetical protein [Acinetobacter sp. ANC 3903]OTG57088.1 hypothetical protein B9T29_15550 [Acinetobacter sp. ANC 3903]